MFTGSSSFSPKPYSPRQSSTRQTSTQNQQANNPSFSINNHNIRLVETIYFENTKITSPYSLSLRFTETDETLSLKSKILIHNIFSYKQHFKNPVVLEAFFYSIRALNLWLKQLENLKFFYENKAAALETRIIRRQQTGTRMLLDSQTLQTFYLPEIK